MWIVRVALQRPYTFIVLAILILLLGVFSILRTAKDIFPNIKIPVVAAIWNYTGLQPEEMATRIVLFTERTAQTTVNDVEHTESQSLNGIAVVKYFFQPTANEELSFAQITGVSQTQLRNSPPGTTPPFILAYNASTVPIIQLALSSDSLSEAEIFDLGNNIVRTGLATIPGAAMPYPYGGKQRQVQVDLDPPALRAKGLSGNDVANAIAAQNLILPAGTEKIGDLEYYIGVNASPKTRRDERSADQRTQRHGDLRARRRARARRLSAADQHRAPRGPARGADERAEDRQELDARHHQCHQTEAAADPCNLARVAEDRGDRRSVAVRALGNLRRGARGGHCRGADRADDPAVPRQLAQHADHFALDSAVDSGLDRLPVGARARPSTS